MKQKYITLLIMVCLLLLAMPSLPVFAEAPGKRYSIPEVTGKVHADGFLKEALWREALVLPLNFEVYPGENTPAPVKTEVLVASSKGFFYVAFRAYDPDLSQLRARICDRDNLGNQDWVSIRLDTFNDERRCYHFMCNPFGVQDEYIETTAGGSSEWDTIWKSGGRITEDGYVVEMAIPFSSLRFQRKVGKQTWGFDAVRNYPRNFSHQFGLFPLDRNNSCYLCQAAKLEGFNGAKPGKNIEFDPTLSAHTTRSRDAGSEGSFEKETKLEPGLTARWGFTPNLTLSATVNPDFSHVEADEPQMDINEPFALSFAEKRPFFMEGDDFFNTRINAVYTRSLRAPSWGIKLTGKEGANTIGAYMVRDTLTNLVFPGSQGSSTTSLAMDSTASVLRYGHDFGSNYTIGLLFTNREGDNYFNRVYGVDGDFRFTSKDRVRFQFLGSSTDYPDDVAYSYGQDQGRFNDKALDAVYSHDSRNLDWYAGYRDMGEDFRADLGFIPQVSYRSFYAGTDYTFYGKPGKWFSRLVLEGNFDQLTDYDDQLLNRRFTLSFVYQGPMQSHSKLEYTRRRELYNGVEFDQDRFFIHHCMKPDKSIHVYANTWFGDRIDYSNTRPGKRLRLSSGFIWDLGLHIKINASHTFERLSVLSKRLYTANQSEFKFVYQFNKRTFVRAILQYVDHRYNVENYLYAVDPAYKHLFSQFLFSYKINPQTVVFLGYSDNYYGFTESGLPQANRTLFMKVGYALVM
ncbi:MAG: carbohydrate binding family 9 domain-containing protein [bacterium]|nr:carbohydrate binding family 9 domain-containing protein [bacterium]